MLKKKTLRKAVLIILTLLLLFIIYRIFSTPSYSETSIYTRVQKGDFKTIVYSTGQLQAEHSVSINAPSELSGRHINIYEIKVTKLIDEGTVVDSGEYVASLDHSAVEEKLAEAQTSLAEKMEAYEDAKIDTNINLSNLRDELITSRIDLEEKQLVLKQSVYESPSVIRQAKLDVDQAQRKLDQDTRNYKLKKQQNKITMIRAESAVSKINTQISEIEALFDALDIKAPAPGMLIYAFDRSGNKIKVGSSITRWAPKIAELPDLTSMISKTFINEIDISKVKKGQKVKVGVDAFPEKEFDGEVTEVANIGQVIPGGDSKAFEVTIKIFGYDKDLKPAMTTSNIISSKTLNDVLYIPLEAVFHNDSLSYIIKAKNPMERQIVETGAENDNYVEILKGVKENEKILMNEPPVENEKDITYTGLDIYNNIKNKTDSIPKDPFLNNQESNVE